MSWCQSAVDFFLDDAALIRDTRLNTRFVPITPTVLMSFLEADRQSTTEDTEFTERRVFFLCAL
ncbi:Uncharacterised protein [uncultured archaeon]|nr:Uncharacterised protein [uncultured archaeon]